MLRLARTDVFWLGVELQRGVTLNLAPLGWGVIAYLACTNNYCKVWTSAGAEMVQLGVQAQLHYELAGFRSLQVASDRQQQAMQGVLCDYKG